MNETHRSVMFAAALAIAAASNQEGITEGDRYRMRQARKKADSRKKRMKEAMRRAVLGEK